MLALRRTYRRAASAPLGGVESGPDQLLEQCRSCSCSAYTTRASLDARNRLRVRHRDRVREAGLVAADVAVRVALQDQLAGDFKRSRGRIQRDGRDAVVVDRGCEVAPWLVSRQLHPFGPYSRAEGPRGRMRVHEYDDQDRFVRHQRDASAVVLAGVEKELIESPLLLKLTQRHNQAAADLDPPSFIGQTENRDGTSHGGFDDPSQELHSFPFFHSTEPEQEVLPCQAALHVCAGEDLASEPENLGYASPLRASEIERSELKDARPLRVHRIGTGQAPYLGQPASQ